MIGPLKVILWMMIFWSNQSAADFGYEVLISKMEHLEDKHLKQQTDIKRQLEAMQQNILDMQQTMITKLSKQMEIYSKQQIDIKRQIEVMQQKDMEQTRITKSNFEISKKIMDAILKQNTDHKIQIEDMQQSITNMQLAKTRQLSEQIKDSLSRQQTNINNKIDVVQKHSMDYLKSIYTGTVTSCTQELSKMSGKYTLRPFKNETPFEVYCEHDAFGGGWLVIQHRFNGSVDFYRDWADYREGFGSMDGEFWLGLEKVHRLTKDKKHSLLIEMKDFDDNYVYAMYDAFEIGSEAEKYALKLGTYSGTAGKDSMRIHKGMKFTTKDNDNGPNDGENCAITYKGAWWYKDCLDSNLNGPYTNVNQGQAISWYVSDKPKDKRVIRKFTKMMIRALL